MNLPPDDNTLNAFKGEPEWLPFWTFAAKAFPGLGRLSAHRAVMSLIYSGVLQERSLPGRGAGTAVRIHPAHKET